MKILPVEKIKEADRYTIENEPVSSIELMERAASEIYKWFMKHCKTKEISVKIFCGTGNNGGDGLALARMLAANDIVAQVFMVYVSENFSFDCKENYNRLKKETEVSIFDIRDEHDFPLLSDEDIIIDAIFGSGLNRALSGWIEKLIKRINESSAIRIAIDIPTGLFADRPVDMNSAVFKADYTLTFQFPKLAFLFPENDVFVGYWEVLDINLHPDFINSVETLNFFTTPFVVRFLLRRRLKYSHKGTYGHAFLVAGSSGKTGAALLSAEACLRTGVGLLSVHLPKNAAIPLQTYLPEAMIDIDKSDDYCSEVRDLQSYTAVGAGPGLGRHTDTVNVLKKIIQETTVPLVLDADALNIISENPTWLSFLPKKTILTPHPKEFERLFGKTYNSFERLELQRKKSVTHNIIIVLKGANTSVSFPDGRCFFNSTGNPGMSTAGSGDVLTGIILSLLAQGYMPEEAAVMGVYLHGLAGDKATESIGMESMIASDISKNLGEAFKSLKLL